MKKDNFLNSNSLLQKSEVSPNVTNNYTTLNSNTSGDRKLNNTNNIGGGLGISSDASMSQTRYGISQILKNLNST